MSNNHKQGESMTNSNGNDGQPPGLVGLYFHAHFHDGGPEDPCVGKVRANIGDGHYLVGVTDPLGNPDQPAHLEVYSIKDMGRERWRFFETLAALHEHRIAVEEILKARAKERERYQQRRSPGPRGPRGPRPPGDYYEGHGPGDEGYRPGDYYEGYGPE
jgi:hypothetical protein